MRLRVLRVERPSLLETQTVNTSEESLEASSFVPSRDGRVVASRSSHHAMDARHGTVARGVTARDVVSRDVPNAVASRRAVSRARRAFERRRRRRAADADDDGDGRDEWW